MASEHGTDSRYTNGKCRCVPCTTAHTIYVEKWAASPPREYGHLPSVRAHIRFLIDPQRPQEQRFSLHGLARHLGVSFGGIAKIYHGQTKRITRSYADRIMAVSLYDLKSTKCWTKIDLQPEIRLCPT